MMNYVICDIYILQYMGDIFNMGEITILRKYQLCKQLIMTPTSTYIDVKWNLPKANTNQSHNDCFYKDAFEKRHHDAHDSLGCIANCFEIATIDFLMH